MQRTLKVVLFGAGFLARTRARCWARVHGFSATVVVAARDRQKAVAFAREHGLAGGCTIDEALADPTVDLVDLCVPNRAHRELAERAFAAGKHVLCTKPLTAYWGQGLPADASAAATR
jgi:predicted dehydrogenase